jgi:hypothetical protein
MTDQEEKSIQEKKVHSLNKSISDPRLKNQYSGTK